MRRKLTVPRPAPGHAPSNRLAWWAAFLTTIALIVLLNVARADAAPLPGGGPPLPLFAGFESEEELAEEEEEEEEAGFGEEEGEEGVGRLGESECDAEEEAECVEETEEEGPPRECRLISTSAVVSAYPRAHRVVLTIHYAARASTRVEIPYRLRGTRGGLRMNTGHGRFSGTGSFRQVQTMTPAQMTRVLGAKSFAVEIRPLGAPAYCHPYFDQRLTTRHGTPHGPVWQG